MWHKDIIRMTFTRHRIENLIRDERQKKRDEKMIKLYSVNNDDAARRTKLKERKAGFDENERESGVGRESEKLIGRS